MSFLNGDQQRVCYYLTPFAVRIHARLNSAGKSRGSDPFYRAYTVRNTLHPVPAAAIRPEKAKPAVRDLTLFSRQGEVAEWLSMGIKPDRVCRKLGRRNPVSESRMSSSYL